MKLQSRAASPITSESARDKNNSLRFQAIGAIVLNVILRWGRPFLQAKAATNHPTTSRLIALGLAPLGTS